MTRAPRSRSLFARPRLTLRDVSARRTFHRQTLRLDLDGLHGYIALVSLAMLVLGVAICLTRLGSNPFVWAVVGLAVITPVGYWPRRGARDTGALLARGGVVIALLAAQIEIGSGPKFYRAAGDWLVVAVAFGAAALAIHLIALSRRRSEAAVRRNEDRERATLEERRHQELLQAIASTRVTRALSPSPAATGAVVLASVGLGVALRPLLTRTRIFRRPGRR